MAGTTNIFKMDTVRHKRGSTLRIRLPLPFPPQGWTITAQLRGGNIVADFEVTIIDPADYGAAPETKGMVDLVIPAPATKTWPTRLMHFDFRAEREGEVVYSQTSGVIVDPEVTQS
ncbi:hypothetical protein KRZ98_06180 [Sphingobium sp. AS12]|uniref:hypothetical protein n=1 Tax=Sphingobium sp. AS12 TaxID=2849495 RepID=UPI001C314914|nr:hypothetical protein [Sphingobium sp. AS12]MBV2147877.1 hypothetical protein [Sphingobium sp. AS12]